MKRAFSLVELSIVLVILGLLVGGVLSGQSLIRAAQIRSVMKEADDWVTATQTFRDKYFALPGDMTNATKFWKSNNSYCSDGSGSYGTPGVCNGNGDGIITEPTGMSVQPSEMFQFWLQLAYAGLITGNYTGISTSGGGNLSDFTNSPSSKLSPGGWTSNQRLTADFTTYPTLFFYYPGVNILQFGAVNSAGSFSKPVLTTSEAWNIDTKMDDGKPGTGKVTAMTIDTCTNATSNTQFNATYTLSSTTSNTCSLAFMSPF